MVALKASDPPGDDRTRPNLGTVFPADSLIMDSARPGGVSLQLAS